MSDNLFDDLEIGQDKPIEKKPGTFEPDNVTMPAFHLDSTEPQDADSPVFDQATMDAALKHAQDVLDQQALKEMAARVATPVPVPVTPAPAPAPEAPEVAPPVVVSKPVEVTAPAVVTVEAPEPVVSKPGASPAPAAPVVTRAMYAVVAATVALLLFATAYLHFSNESAPAATPAATPAPVQVAPVPVVEPVASDPVAAPTPVPAKVAPAPVAKPAPKKSTLSKEDLEFLKTLNNAL